VLFALQGKSKNRLRTITKQFFSPGDNGGSNFSFWIPCTEEEDPKTALPATKLLELNDPPATSVKRSVLLVDDNAVNQAVIKYVVIDFKVQN
jgi:hypothetical protein